MEVKHKKLGISIIGDRMTPELSFIESICEYLERLPSDMRSSLSGAVPFKNLMLAVELYKNNIITLGKFSELIGLPVHDSARILESIGIRPELGASTKKELDEEIKAAIT
jgi:hypothetical protein